MALEQFHFTTSDSDDITVPYAFDSIRRKEMRKITNQYKDNQEDMDLALMKAAGFTKEQLDMVDNMTMRDYQKFTTGWMDSDDMPVGK